MPQDNLPVLRSFSEGGATESRQASRRELEIAFGPLGPSTSSGPAREGPRPESFPGDRMVVNMGPQHPSTHGVLRLVLVTDGEIVQKVTPYVGYMHRCFEKHAEKVPYSDCVPYVDRVDYLAAMNGEFGWALAVEKLMGIKVPERVEYIRVIVAELNRIASHLVAVGTYGLDIGSGTPFFHCFRDREKVLDILEGFGETGNISGARFLYNYIRPGGLMNDVTPGFLKAARQFIDTFEYDKYSSLNELDILLTTNKIFIDRTADVGILKPDRAIQYGFTGPNLRGSGVKRDLRRNEPYSIYPQLEFEIPIGTGEFGTLGSCWDRYMVRVREMRESARIVRQCLDRIPPGDIKEGEKQVKSRPPVGAVYVRSEMPRGELGFYIVSDGSPYPYRVHVRAPSFLAIAAMDELCRNVLLADVMAILGSIDIVLCEVDR